jgi:hypothetical protein
MRTSDALDTTLASLDASELGLCFLETLCEQDDFALLRETLCFYRAEREGQVH